ncbi:MAG: diacylglycerol kinase family protein [Oscillospiraceae bacterium]|nr:diacylglycerol kinase family protein [Oscillospiraceae bacterium]
MRSRLTAFRNSFLYALRGIRYAAAHERNMRFHLSAAVLVTAFSVVYGLSAAEYGTLFFAVGLVLTAEAINTAVEKTVDLASPGRHPLAAIAKDAAAGAVLLAALTSAAVGFCLFLHFPRLTDTFLCILTTPGLLILFAALFAAGFLFTFFGDRLFKTTVHKENL